MERPPEKAGLTIQGARVVTEDDIRKAMSQAIVKQVLSMGIDASRVKIAIKKRLENSGNHFDTPESLISAAFSEQRHQEHRNQQENRHPVGAMLGGLGELRINDSVTERWEIGQDNSEISDEHMEDLQQPPDTSNDTISLNQPRSPQQPQQAQPVAPSNPVSEKVPAKPGSAEAGNTDLMSENTRLKEQRTCKICMDGEVGVVFLPCGHLCSCVNCAPALKDCPVCRRAIQGTVRTFLS